MQTNQTSDDLLALFDNAPLNRRYWTISYLMSAVFVFDFFDFLVVGYLLAAVAREWHLTYGQSAIILYSVASARSWVRWSSAPLPMPGAASSRW